MCKTTKFEVTNNMNDHGIGASFFDGRHGKNKELKGF
jgi:hypothetical protein